MVQCKNYSADTCEEGKKGKINFRPGIKPVPLEKNGEINVCPG